MSKHKIGWLNRPGTTGETWNPITGCSPVSAGCLNCYAARMAKRFGESHGYPADEPFRVTFHPDRLERPSRWKKPKTIFVCSMGDLFHEDVEAPWVYRVLEEACFCEHHTFIVLTKRPKRMATVMSHEPIVLPNLWLGVTAEDQAAADERVPLLLKTPAAVRWVSVEPMLEETDLAMLVDDLDWVVIGCESGPRRRPCKPEWVEALVEQCQEAGVAVYVKQLDLGGAVSKDPDEWPEELRIREWPK